MENETNEHPTKEGTTKAESTERTQSAVKSFLIAAIWVFLALVWTDMNAVFRIAAAAAGIGFAVEGVLKLRKK